MPAAGYPIEFLSVRGLDRRNPLRALGAVARAGAAVGAARGLLGAARRGRGARRRAATSPGPVGPGGGRAPHAARADRGRQPPRPREPACSRPSRAACASRSRSRAATASATSSPAARCRARWSRPTATRRASGSAFRPTRSACSCSAAASAPQSVNLAAVEALARRGCHRPAHHRAARLRRGARRASASAAGYRVLEYLDSLADPLAACDLVVARAGGSVFEIAAAGTARDPDPVSARDRRPPGQERALDGRRPAPRWCCPTTELDPERLRARGAGAAGRPGAARADGRRRPSRRAARRRRRDRRAGARRRAGRTPRAEGGPGESVDQPWSGRKLHFVGIGGAGHERPGADRAGAGRRGQRLRRARRRRTSTSCAPPASSRVSATMPRTRSRTRSWSSPRRSPPTCPRSRRARARRPVHHRGSCWPRPSPMRRVIAVARHARQDDDDRDDRARAGGVRRGAGLRGRRGAAAAGGGHRPNAVWGSGEWMVVEADESDRSFLNFEPEVAVLTNVELDHHSTYASELEVRAAFDEFLASVRPGGTVVAWEGAGVVRPGVRVRPLARMRRCGRATCGPPARACGSRSCVDGEDVADGRPAGARGAQRPERARGDRRRARRRRTTRRAPRGARLASSPRAGGSSSKGEAARGAGVRRLCPPRDRGGGHACRGARARRRSAWWPCSSLTCTRAPLHTHDDLGRALARRGRGRGAGRVPRRGSARRTTPGRERRAGRARGGRPRRRTRGVVAAHARRGASRSLAAAASRVTWS